MADIQYHSIPGGGDCKPKRHREQLPHLYQEVDTRAPSRSLSHWAWLAHAVLLSISITILAVSFCLIFGSHAGHGGSLYNAPPSPAAEYGIKRVGLGSEWRDSPYVGQGSNVDSAWSSLADENAGDIFITEAEAKRLAPPPHSWKMQHPGTGEWGYRAGVEVFHQLRCLNLLRIAAHRKVDQTGADTDVDYCVELLRDVLTCHSDAGIFTLRSAPEQAGRGMEAEQLGSGGDRMCRNFEALRKWSTEHSI
ncbi:hypothetical protein C8A00DRAFT_15070 [Chaetomidium leptoderma]|uniref:Oxidase ustYa n=1 Tax=Chaetomidium leptoderma TaxID=669021 RepID=A0AAN6VM36_9PEZI|nr:hypothetical protein C8A00DRAFT_15070 [Chaetomidium leptoderma]